MSDTFRLTLAQLNPTVGDIAGNPAKARAAWAAARPPGPISWRCPRCSWSATSRRTW